MKISVVTVCLNAEATIPYTIESFLGQVHPAKELVLVDGGSSDATLAIARSFRSNAIRISSGPDEGIYDAMNKGLTSFAGDAVGFLNADDAFADAGVLSELAKALAKADIAFGNLDFVSDHATGRIIRRWRGTPFRKGAFRRGWMPAHPTFYVRRTVAESVGAFDPRYRFSGDYEYMLRALEIGSFRSVFIDRVLVKMMQGGESTASVAAFIRHNHEALRARRRWLGTPLVDFAMLAKPARKLGQFSSTSIAKMLAGSPADAASRRAAAPGKRRVARAEAKR